MLLPFSKMVSGNFYVSILYLTSCWSREKKVSFFVSSLNSITKDQLRKSLILLKYEGNRFVFWVLWLSPSKLFLIRFLLLSVQFATILLAPFEASKLGLVCFPKRSPFVSCWPNKHCRLLYFNRHAARSRI